VEGALENEVTGEKKSVVGNAPGSQDSVSKKSSLKPGLGSGTGKVLKRKAEEVRKRWKKGRGRNDDDDEDDDEDNLEDEEGEREGERGGKRGMKVVDDEGDDGDYDEEDDRKVKKRKYRITKGDQHQGGSKESGKKGNVPSVASTAQAEDVTAIVVPKRRYA